VATRWLTPGEAAEKLGVSESTVWRFLRREQLASVKVGGRRRIPASALRGVARAARAVSSPRSIAPFTIDDALFRLAGRFRGAGSEGGAAEKHRHLGAKA
jgi:excisionase family DNA binding protein